MNGSRAKAVVGLVGLGIVVSLALGCREEVPPLFRRNQPPETTLTIIAEDSTQAFYRYHVYWRGEDPDGQVIRYLFAITDTLSRNEDENWDPSLAVDRERGVFTTRSDSVFIFNSAVGRQAFNIVAIDDFGEMDPSPARAFFRIIDNGLPRVEFIDVVPFKQGLLPCASTEPCTVSTFTDFKVRFRGVTGNGFVNGVTWQVNPPAWEPFGASIDTLFVNPLVDTLVMDAQGDTAWAIDDGVVSVFVRSTRDKPINPGSFRFRARVRDEARLTSLLSRGVRTVTVNYDPDTRLYEDPGCSGPVGWIVGVGNSDSFTIDEWIPFCNGDTIPNLSKVLFYAQGQDDPRDEPNDPQVGLPETQYRFRFEYAAPGFSNRNMEFSSPARIAADLPLPGGGTFRGAQATWRTCPFDYRFEAGAVDEQRKIDGTPAAIEFFVGGAPQIDSIQVPPVFVFVPDCGNTFPQFCVQADPASFGPDTLLVQPTHIPDDPIDGFQTPFGLGWNEFVFPFKAWAHDHPRDRNPPGRTDFYTQQDEGRIRAWLYSFDCTEPACQDHVLAGEDVWRSEVRDAFDPPGQEVFDEDLRIVIPLDTLCTADPCTQQSIRAVLSFERFGAYEFTLKGRDTETIGQRCIQPSDLGDDPSQFTLDISERGRETQTVVRQTVWRQLMDVRPIGKPSGVTRSKGPQPFANHKRLMQ